MIIRRITVAELPELLRLYTFLHPEDPSIDPTDDAVQRIWAQIVANDNLRYYGVVVQNRIVATCTLTIIPNLT